MKLLKPLAIAWFWYWTYPGYLGERTYHALRRRWGASR